MKVDNLEKTKEDNINEEIIIVEDRDGNPIVWRR